MTDEKLLEQGKLIQEGADVKAELAKELNQFQQGMTDFGNPVEPNPLDHSQPGGFFKEGGEINDKEYEKGGGVEKKTKNKPMAKSKGATANKNRMKEISAEAKKIYAENPKMKWTDCIKKASQNLKK